MIKNHGNDQELFIILKLTMIHAIFMVIVAWFMPLMVTMVALVPWWVQLALTSSQKFIILRGLGAWVDYGGHFGEIHC